MKRLIIRMLAAIWRKTAFVRRPIMRRVDHRLTLIIQRVVDPGMVGLETNMGRLENSMGRLEINMGRLEANQCTTLARQEGIHGCVYEVNLVLNSVVREVARLQMEVEALQQMVEESANRRSSLSIVGESDDHKRFSERGGEHAQVG